MFHRQETGDGRLQCLWLHLKPSDWLVLSAGSCSIWFDHLNALLVHEAIFELQFWGFAPTFWSHLLLFVPVEFYLFWKPVPSVVFFSSLPACICKPLTFGCRWATIFLGLHFEKHISEGSFVGCVTIVALFILTYVQKDKPLHFAETVGNIQFPRSVFYYPSVLQGEQKWQADLKPLKVSRECRVFLKDSKGQNHVSYLSEQVDGGLYSCPCE